MRFAVFLDDVLNTRTTCERIPEGYVGIDDARASLFPVRLK